MQRSNKFWLPVFVFGLATTWFMPTVQGDDKEAQQVVPSGTWKWERTFNDNTRTFVLRLKMDGDKVTGTYQGSRDEGKITDGKMDGDMLSFQYKRETGDFQFTVKYQGKVSEDTIKGTIEFSSDRGTREFDWEAKRSTELEDVLGNWKLKIETGEGNVLEPSIRFTKEGDKLKGAYVGPRDTHREATNIKVVENKLTFEISGEDNENAFNVVYTGKPRGDSIKGTIDYDFNGNTGTVDFQGKRLQEKEKNAAAKPAEKVTARGHTTDSLKTVQQRLVDNTAVLVDVREQHEWDQGHLEAAVLVQLSKLKEESDSKDFVEQLAQILPQDKIIYCHCRAGGRALVATSILQKMGYDVRPLKAGYADLLKAGFSTGNQQLTDKLD